MVKISTDHNHHDHLLKPVVGVLFTAFNSLMSSTPTTGIKELFSIAFAIQFRNGHFLASVVGACRLHSRSLSTKHQQREKELRLISFHHNHHDHLRSCLLPFNLKSAFANLQLYIKIGL
jgi:hypothetical protein